MPRRYMLLATLAAAACNCDRQSNTTAAEFPIHAPAQDYETSRELALQCAHLSTYPSHWDKIDATDWHSESANEQGLDYDAAGAHIAYWYAWLILHDLHSGFACTESPTLIQQHFRSIQRLKAGSPNAIDSILAEAEELHSPMMTDAGQAFTAQHYRDYLTDYRNLFGKDYAEFSEQNFAKVQAMLEAKYAPLLTSH